MSQKQPIAINLCCLGCQLVQTLAASLHNILHSGPVRPAKNWGRPSLLQPPDPENPSYATGPDLVIIFLKSAV